MAKKKISRRDFFKRLIPGKALDTDEDEEDYDYTPDYDYNTEVMGENQIAVIQGRYCLAYQGGDCTRCLDHCPVSGAIDMTDDGFPVIISDICTGCQVCKDVCPSSADAILMIESPC